MMRSSQAHALLQMIISDIRSILVFHIQLRSGSHGVILGLEPSPWRIGEANRKSPLKNWHHKIAQNYELEVLENLFLLFTYIDRQIFETWELQQLYKSSPHCKFQK